MAEAKKSLAEMSRAELAALPVEIIPGPEQPSAKRRREAREREERRRAETVHKELEAMRRQSQEPPIPADVLQRAKLPGLPAAEAILVRRQRCEDERTALEVELAEARTTHERNRFARAERHAAAIVQGQAPKRDDGADRRETEAIREVEIRVDQLARAERQLEAHARETLADAIRTVVWPTHRRLRREGLQELREACRFLAAAQGRMRDAERAALNESTRVRKALQIGLGQAQPDDPAAATIRRYFEGDLRVPQLQFTSAYHKLPPRVVLEALATLERELASLDGGKEK